MKITGIRPLSDDTVEIQAIDEVAAYYAAKDLALTDPLPKLLGRTPKILAINVSETLIETGGGYAVEIVVTLVVEGDWRGGVHLGAAGPAGAPHRRHPVRPGDARRLD